MQCKKCQLQKEAEQFYQPTAKNKSRLTTCKVCLAIEKRIRNERNNQNPFKNLDGEVWVGILEAPDKYEISNKGRLRSLYREMDGEKIWTYLTPKILMCGLNNYGYKMAILRINGDNVGRLLHRMLAQAFLPNPQKLPFINHKDCNKVNNQLANLEWCTQKENVRHAFKMGVVNTTRGEKCGRSRLKEKYIEGIFTSKESSVSLAKKFNVHPASICAIKNRKSWRHVTDKL